MSAETQEPAIKKRRTMSSWVEYAPDCDFPIQNLPYGIFSPAGGAPRAGVAIGDQVLDLSVLAAAGCFNGAVPGDGACFSEGTLNSFMGMGKSAWDATRATVTRLLSVDEAELRGAPLVRARSCSADGSAAACAAAARRRRDGGSVAACLPAGRASRTLLM